MKSKSGEAIILTISMIILAVGLWAGIMHDHKNIKNQNTVQKNE